VGKGGIKKRSYFSIRRGGDLEVVYNIVKEKKKRETFSIGVQ